MRALDRRWFALLALGSLLTLPGCVCFPFVTPPLELSGGAAVAGEEGEVSGAFPIDFSARPAAAFESAWDRNFDVGVGYRLVPTTSDQLYHGPTLSAGWLLPLDLKAPVNGESDGGFRLGVTGQGNVVLGNRVDDPRLGATLRFTAEWVIFTSGDFDSCTQGTAEPGYSDLDGDGVDDNAEDGFSCSFGHSSGEAGIGIFTEASLLDLGDRSIYWAGLGLTLRIPASFGIAIASILD